MWWANEFVLDKLKFSSQYIHQWRVQRENCTKTSQFTGGEDDKSMKIDVLIFFYSKYQRRWNECKILYENYREIFLLLFASFGEWKKRQKQNNKDAKKNNSHNYLNGNTGHNLHTQCNLCISIIRWINIGQCIFLWQAKTANWLFFKFSHITIFIIFHHISNATFAFFIEKKSVLFLVRYQMETNQE